VFYKLGRHVKAKDGTDCVPSTTVSLLTGRVELSNEGFRRKGSGTERILEGGGNELAEQGRERGGTCCHWEHGAADFVFDVPPLKTKPWLGRKGLRGTGKP